MCSLAGTLKLSNNELGAEALDRGAGRVRQVLGIDARSVGSVTDTIAVSTNIERLGDPVGRDTTGEGRETVYVQGRGAAVGVDIAGQSGLVLWVTDQEDALDGVEVGAGDLGHGVYGRGRALAVAFEDEAFVGVGGEA